MSSKRINESRKQNSGSNKKARQQPEGDDRSQGRVRQQPEEDGRSQGSATTVNSINLMIFIISYF